MAICTVVKLTTAAGCSEYLCYCQCYCQCYSCSCEDGENRLFQTVTAIPIETAASEKNCLACYTASPNSLCTLLLCMYPQLEVCLCCRQCTKSSPECHAATLQYAIEEIHSTSSSVSLQMAQTEGSVELSVASMTAATYFAHYYNSIYCTCI